MRSLEGTPQDVDTVIERIREARSDADARLIFRDYLANNFNAYTLDDDEKVADKFANLFAYLIRRRPE